MKEIVLIGILFASPFVLGDEIPKDVENSLIEQFNTLLCKDSVFVKCAKISSDKCTKVVSEAVNTCDYSPVWNEIQKLDIKTETVQSASGIANEYGGCINNYIQRKLQVNNHLFELCLDSSFERYVETIKQNRSKE